MRMSPFSYLPQWDHTSPVLLARVVFKKPLQIIKILKITKPAILRNSCGCQPTCTRPRVMTWQAVKTGQEECQNLLLEHTWISKVPPSYLSVLSSGWYCSIKTQLNHLLAVSTNKAFKDVMHELKKIKCLRWGYR